MDKDLHIASGAIVHKVVKGKTLWFITKESDEGGWEIPKTSSRRGESSVRAAIRMMAEQGGMDVKALEEAGRSGGAAKVKDKLVTQRTYFYLMAMNDGGEVLGFTETAWLEYAQAVRKLASKREQGMLREANKILKKLQREAKAAEKIAG